MSSRWSIGRLHRLRGSTIRDIDWPMRKGVTSVILAAGFSRRMGSPKPLLKLRGKSFLRTIIDRHRLSSLPVCVVLGRHNLHVAEEVDLSDTTVVVNPDPSRGALSSLLVAMGHLGEPEGLLIHPVDHPLVLASTLEYLVQRHRLLPASILIPSVHGRKGHPVLFPRRFFFDLRHAPLEEGARWVVHQNPASTFLVPVEDPGILVNINIPAQVSRLARGEVLGGTDDSLGSG